MEPGQNPVPAVLDRKQKDLLFQRWSNKSYREMYLHSIRYIRRELSICIMKAHNINPGYLDLAVVSCFRCKKRAVQKRDHFKCQTILDLPPAVAEYLIAETEIHETYKMHRLFEAVDKFERSYMRDQRIQNTFVEILFRKFLLTVIDKVEGWDRPQKITSFRAFLNLHQVFELHYLSMTQFRFLIHVCMNPEPDPELTIELLSTIDRFDLLKQQTFLEMPYDFFQTLLRYAKAMGFDFWGLWRGIGEFSAEYNPLVQYITNHNNPFAALLMHYGFPFSCDVGIYKKQWYTIIARRLDNICSDLLFSELKEKQNRTRMMLILTTFMAFVDIEEAGDVPADSINILVLLMRCVPEPFVVPSEMVLELMPFILPTFHEDLRRISYNYSTADIFDESYSIHKPRRLKHHCRCTIRRVIANNLGLPEGINELQLPESIKNYLSLGC